MPPDQGLISPLPFGMCPGGPCLTLLLWVIQTIAPALAIGLHSAHVVEAHRA
ncbi:hypothetical protein PF007_g26100 [Phytophthora fragariae]|uniref:Uncharacterized protein n=1 Tax=Phytophthora fragariae TaxID=53985 RepID=A0A6A3QBK2_9STRA|nr:hypothetical protein PF007_g26100 [Phytophthora fragariae]